MDERSKVLFVTGAVLLLLLAIVAGTIFYFTKGFRSSQKPAGGINLPKPSATYSAKPSSTSSQSPSPATGAEEIKNYQGVGFEIFYPKKWGLLTCSNSQNFELDPTSSTDFKGVKCDRAQKPITILLGATNCSGEKKDLGNTQVVSSKISVPGYIKYHWCVLKPSLDITHRISTDNSPATSRDDYSSQIEEMIQRIRTGGGS